MNNDKANINIEDIGYMNSYNSINHVRIADDKTPLVLFLGAAYSGKSVTLIRLIRFLEARCFKAVPDINFRPSEPFYQSWCNEFRKYVFERRETPPGHTIGDALLIKIFNPTGQIKAQIIDIPGEAFFPAQQNIIRYFIPYIEWIFNRPNKKIWVFFVEQNWFQNEMERNIFTQRINATHRFMSPKDKVVFLFNKTDKLINQYDRYGKPIKELFFSNIMQEYPGIFSDYQNFGLRRLCFGKYNFQSLCFSAGNFIKTKEGREIWINNGDGYCLKLWKAISKYL